MLHLYIGNISNSGNIGKISNYCYIIVISVVLVSSMKVKEKLKKPTPLCDQSRQEDVPFSNNILPLLKVLLS